MYLKIKHAVHFSCTLLILMLCVSFFLYINVPVAGAQNKNQNAMVADLLQQGRTEMEEKNYAKAIVTFNEVIKINTKHVEAHFRIGTAYWRQRKVREALGYMNKAIEFDPKNVSLRLSLAGFYEQVKMIDRAIEQYKQIIALAKNTEQARTAEKRLNLALVKAYAAGGDVDTALQLLNSMLEEHPGDPRILQHLGFAYLLANRYEAAVAIYENVLESEPNNDSAHMNLAGVYEKMGDLKSAIAHLEAVAEGPASAGRKAEARIRAGLFRATVAQNKGDLDGAILFLKEILEFRPAHAVASNRLAAVYRTQNKFDLSEEILLKSIKLVPKNIDGRLNLASLFLQRNNLLDAVWHLDNILNTAPDTTTGKQAQALMQQITQRVGQNIQKIRNAAVSKYNLIDFLEKEPENAKARYQLASIYFKQGIYKQALPAFEKVRELDPDNAGVYLHLGELYSKNQKYAASATAFAKHIALSENIQNLDRLKLAYATVLGQQFYEEKKLEQSLYQFRRVLKSQPKDTLASYYSALILSRQGEVEEAASLYEAVIEKAPNHIGAHSNVAIIYEQLEKEEKALSHYRKILTTEQTKQVVDNAEKRIAFLEKKINGLTTTASYAMTVDNNSNLSESEPDEEYYSTLSANFLYRYKYSDAIRTGIRYAPSYSTYHIGQYDFYNQLISPFVAYERKKNKATLTYSYNKLQGILNEQNINNTQSFKLDWNHTLRQGRTSDLSISFRQYEAATSSLFDASTWTLGGVYQRGLGSGYSDSFSYTYNLNMNDNPQNVDAAYQSHELSYSLNKWLSASTFASFSVSGRMTGYDELDRIALARRKSAFFSIRGSINYRLNPAVRLFGNISYQLNDSNLPIFVCPARNEDGSQVTREDCRPLNSTDIIGAPQQSASLGTFSKTIVGFGLSVSF